MIDQVLTQHGIECNYVNGNYSGVSMSRYRKIVRLLRNEYSIQQSISSTLNQISTNIITTHGYGIPIILSYLWDKIISKQCILDFYLSIEKTMGDTIIHSDYSNIRIHDSNQHKSWIESEYIHEDFNETNIYKATELLFMNINNNITNNTYKYNEDYDNKIINKVNNSNQIFPNMNIAVALELLSSSIAIEYLFKKPIKLGS